MKHQWQTEELIGNYAKVYHGTTEVVLPGKYVLKCESWHAANAVAAILNLLIKESELK